MKLLENIFIALSVSFLGLSLILKFTSPHQTTDSRAYIKTVCSVSTDSFCEAKRINEKYRHVGDYPHTRSDGHEY